MPTWFEIAAGERYYCIVGSPVQHSKSPFIHGAFARQRGLEIRYEKIEVRAGDLTAAADEFHHLGGCGMNVTVPLKEEAYAAAAVVRSRAARAGAANTLWFDERGALVADNTDGVGLVRDLCANHGFDLRGKRVLLVGAGGAARGALPALLDAAVAAVTVVNRTGAKARALASLVANPGLVCARDFAELGHASYDLILNATSLSLQGTLPPLPAAVVGPHTWCYDMMYAAEPTVFMQWGKSHGAGHVADGLGMLVEQAAESFFLWHGVEPRTPPVIEALRSSWP